MKNFGMPDRAKAFALAAIVAVAACQDEDGGVGLAPPREPALSLQGAIVASSLGATVGEEVFIALKPGQASGATFVGLEGEMQYDSRLLRLKGQVPDGGTMVVANTSTAGRIRLQALNVTGLAQSAAIFSFEVTGAGWENALSFSSDHYVTLDKVDYQLRFTRGAVGQERLDGAPARMMTTLDWADYLQAPSVPARVVSQGGQEPGSDKWGDVNGDNLVNVNDNLSVANISVGNTGQAECIMDAGAITPRPDCIAANVDPANAPGVGGPADPCPPGMNSCVYGGRTINVLDNLEISLESVTCGANPAQCGLTRLVAGKSMQFTAGGGGPGTVADTVDLCAGFAGSQRVVKGTLSLTNTHLYQLRGCRLTIGVEFNSADSAGVLNIEAGTIVEGSDSSSLDVSRNGQVFALGTALQPVLITCINDGPSAPLRLAGCWGGMQVAGNAQLNLGNSGTNPNVIPGRNPAGAGAQSALEGFTPANVFYGGTNDLDNSGTLRYVIVMYGGRLVGPNNELNNLTIGACGSGTTLEYIETWGGADDGLEIFGGRCNVRGLYSGLNDDDQFDLSFGYDGMSQFVFLRNSPAPGNADSTLLATDTGLEFDGTETAPYTQGPPFTRPVIWNLTAINGDSAALGADKFANIRRNAGASINNALLINYATGFDIDDTPSCTQIGTTLTVHGVLLSVVAPAIAGTNCPVTNMNAHFTNQQAANAYATAAYAGQLKQPFRLMNPDIRPTSGASLGTAVSPMTPSGSSFLDASAVWVGAAPPTSSANGGIPFYAGWVKHAQTATQR